MASKGYQVEQDIVGATPDTLDRVELLNKVSQWSVAFSGGDQYATATAIRRGAKPFIIGIIPPDVETNYVPIERNLDRIADVAGGAVGGVGTSSPSSTGLKSDAFYRKLAQVAQSVGCSPYDLMAVLYSESGLNPQAEYVKDGKHVVARGLNQITPAATKVAGMSMDFWKNEYGKLSDEEQLPYVERYLKGVYEGSYSNSTQLYTANFAPGFTKSAGNPNAKLYVRGADPKDNYELNKGLDHPLPGSKEKKGYITVGDMSATVESNKKKSDFKAHVDRMESVIGRDATHAVGSRKPGYALALDGTSSADQASSPPTALGGVMANGNVTTPEEDDAAGTRTGRNIRVSDTRLAVVMKQVRELQSQVEEARAIPGLLMLVNPSSFQRSYEATVDAPKARGGHVVHMWLERPLSISCQGVTAVQFAIDSSGNGGATGSHRVHSISYRNLMSLVATYRNNGQLYTGQSGDSSQNGVPTLSMSVFIYYDGHVYIGSFDDLSVTDSADKPFNMAYSWKFTARYDHDVSSVADGMIERALAMGQGGPWDSAPAASAVPKDGFSVAYPDGTESKYPVPDGASVPSSPTTTSLTSVEGGIEYHDIRPTSPKPGGYK